MNRSLFETQSADRGGKMGSRPMRKYVGSCHCGAIRFEICGIYPFHRKRVTPDYFGVNVFCLEDFEPGGIPVRDTDGAGMP